MNWQRLREKSVHLGAYRKKEVINIENERSVYII